ncbi:MAG TPA: hypothetical protein VLX91_14105 [Candidatus Acidoferrales bacterium]|nr:hypothetical protein [Candidatus Acidoferrales bacterium]
MGKIVFTSYISHGAPTSLIERTKIHDIYENLGTMLKEHGVDTVIISSPHYFSGEIFEVESREHIPCIQDYMGFPEELYKFSYDAKNNLRLVSKIIAQSKSVSLNVKESKLWGLDHGAWLPLYFMFPERNAKIIPVSITSASPEDHFRFGSAIKSAAEKTEGTIAVIGTGSPMHRLDLIRYGYHGEERFEPGGKFGEKLIEVVASRDFDKILNIQREYSSLFHAAAPEGKLNPLYIALGASEKNQFVGKTILHEFMYYGVSLVAMILSAEEGMQKALGEIESEETAA